MFLHAPYRLCPAAVNLSGGGSPANTRKPSTQKVESRVSDRNEKTAAERQAATRAKPGERADRRATQKFGERSDHHEGEAAAKAAKMTGANRQYVAAIQ